MRHFEVVIEKFNKSIFIDIDESKDVIDVVKDKILYNNELRVDRGMDQTIRVQIYNLTYANGKPQKILEHASYMPVGVKPRTVDEYNSDLKKILETLPIEFRGYVSSSSYEEGHSSGYDEIINLAQSMAEDLNKAIDAYTLRIKPISFVFKKA